MAVVTLQCSVCIKVSRVVPLLRDLDSESSSDDQGRPSWNRTSREREQIGDASRNKCREIPDESGSINFTPLRPLPDDGKSEDLY